jgi:predicted N-acetyltransferase YhbS
MELQAPRREEHLETLAELFAVTFSDYWDRRRYVQDGYIEHSDYDWTASRIGIVDGEVATHFGVWDRQMRIGDVPVRVAAVGAVATLEHHQKQGLMAQTAAGCVDALKGAGYELSLLFGIPGFYHRFGFVRSFADGTFRINTRDVVLPQTQPSFTSGEADVPALSAAYNEENASVTGTWVRPTYGTNRKPATCQFYQFDEGYLFVQRKGDELQVVDCVGEPARVVAIAALIARQEICPTISFPFLPRRSPTGEYLQTLRHRYEVFREVSGGPMFKMVNLVATSEKLLPLWTRRLAEGGWGSYNGTLLLAGDGEAIVLTIRNGTAATVQPLDADRIAKAASSDQYSGVLSAGTSLVRFYVGDDLPQRIVHQSGATARGDAGFLLPVLFPFEEPSTILWDRF